MGDMKKEDRAELAKKLDDDLDKLMDELAKNNSQTAGGTRKDFNFDEWARELDEHPAFMKELPADGRELPEALMALQALKYDEDDPKETAEGHKIEGNKHFRLKKYRWAIEAYTNGIKAMCADRQLNAVLFANRAAAHVHLGNRRSAIRDCVMARRFDAHHHKAVLRAADCLLELGYAAQCVNWIDGCDRTAMDGDTLRALDERRRSALDASRLEERDRRKKTIQLEKESKEKRRLMEAIRARGIRLRPAIALEDVALFDWAELQVQLPQLEDHPRVYMGENDHLYWPLLLQYPEYAQTDFVRDCCETTTLASIVERVLDGAAAWDTGHRYRADRVRLFFADADMNNVISVSPSTTIGEMIQREQFTVEHGLPVLLVYADDYASRVLQRVHGDVWKVA